jgi:tol-pal system protein YbgF
MRILLGIVMILTSSVSAVAQDRAQTLADIRQDLNVLYVDMQRLKRELSTTQAANSAASNGSVLDRLNALEEQVQRLTSSTEELDYRINRIVTDGTNRIGDLEFRLVELEGGDISKLGETTTLGGDIDTRPVAPAPENVGPELAIGEKVDFDNASRAFEDGRYQESTDMLARFTQTYPDSPLMAQALLIRGKAYEELKDHKSGARSYLEGFSTYPVSEVAPETLYRLGDALGKLGQTDAGCQTLTQVEIRFPGNEFVAKAAESMKLLQCP